MASDTPAPNEDDDLFNFDALFKSAPKSAVAPAAPAAPVAAQAAAPVAPVQPAAPVPEPARLEAQGMPVAPIVAGKPAPPRLPPGVIMPLDAHALAHASASLPLVKAVSVTREPDAGAIPAPLEPETRPRPRAGAVTLAALAVAAVLNLALVGVVWRSMSGMGRTLREVGEHVARAGESIDHAAGAPPAGEEPLDLQPSAAESGSATLELAADDIRQGEFERARVRVYSLLAVLDSFEARLRPNLAARAQVLAADSYRAQADQVERAAMAEPGFLPAATEVGR